MSNNRKSFSITDAKITTSSTSERSTHQQQLLSSTSMYNTICRLYIENQRTPIVAEKIHTYSNILYQIWMRQQFNVDEGEKVLNFLETLLFDAKIDDQFLIILVETLAKNQEFFINHVLNHERLKKLFSQPLKKVIFIMRYMELLYFYTSSEYSEKQYNFYRFIIDYLFDYLIKHTQYDIDCLGAFCTLLARFDAVENHHLDQSLFRSQQRQLQRHLIILKRQHLYDFSIYTIDTFLHHTLNINNSRSLLYHLRLIDEINKVLVIIWQEVSTPTTTSPSFTVVQQPIQILAIEHLFLELSSMKWTQTHPTQQSIYKTTFSSAIIPLFAHINLDIAEYTLKQMFAVDKLTGEKLARLIKRLIELISTPVQYLQHVRYETWIQGFFMGLITFNQHYWVAKTIDDTLFFLLEKLYVVNTRENAFQIISWYIDYDKRLKTFQTVLKVLPKLFDSLQQEENEQYKNSGGTSSSAALDDLRPKIVEMCHVALSIHETYDFTNDLILRQIMRGYPLPDMNIVKQRVNQHNHFHSTEMIDGHQQKSPTNSVSESSHIITSTTATTAAQTAKNNIDIGRVGIINLGNTCYVNSVLQALYHCDQFRKFICEYHFDNLPILREIQVIFSSLKLSKRPYINVANIVNIVRPPWFNHDQQDCVEFLGYLLDSIKDEQKRSATRSFPDPEQCSKYSTVDSISAPITTTTSSSISHTEIIFGIKTIQVNRCLRCHAESRQEESANYLFLPIPSVESITATTSETDTMNRSERELNRNCSIGSPSIRRFGRFYSLSTPTPQVSPSFADQEEATIASTVNETLIAELPRNGNSASEDVARQIAATLVSVCNRHCTIFLLFKDKIHSDGKQKSAASSVTFHYSISPPTYSSTMTTSLVTPRLSLHQTLNSNVDISLNLQYAFDYYFQKEELKEDNQYRCVKCRSLQDAERFTVLLNAPEYLVLSLNRFEYDKTTNVFRKIFTKMSYPKILNVQYQPLSEQSSSSAKYCLVCIIVHTGYTLHGGHYYCYARDLKPTSTTT
ncbi:unnamed protein product, partial [Didymodactylos carnosus]